MKKGELALIDWIRRQSRFSPAKIIRGIGDDAAVFSTKHCDRVIITTDMIQEDVHFSLADASPFRVGWKAMAVNISDCAAMGIPPVCAVACVSLRDNLPMRFALDLYKGMRKAADRFAVDIIGGDVVSGKSVSVAVTVVGFHHKLKPVYRSGARPGDDIFVTGTLGGSMCGKHLSFVPRLKEALILNKKFKLGAMIDISDGLSLDLKHICDESRCGALIYESAIPISTACRRHSAQPLASALNDGEDFELLFTLNKIQAARLQRHKPLRTRLTKIGEITKKGYALVTKNGKIRTIRPKGYEHFK